MNLHEKRLFLVQQSVKLGIGLKLKFSLSKTFYEMNEHTIEKNYMVVMQIISLQRDKELRLIKFKGYKSLFELDVHNAMCRLKQDLKEYDY